jgi:hypothetical protein
MHGMFPFSKAEIRAAYSLPPEMNHNFLCYV